MKLSDITKDGACFVFSTSYRFCFPFPFSPSTTVGPTGPDRATAFSRAISIMWRRKDRSLLPALHEQLYTEVELFGIDRLYRLAVLSFAWRGRPRKGLEILAADAIANVEFPLSSSLLESVRSFVPAKLPTAEQLAEARAMWSGLANQAKKG